MSMDLRNNLRDLKEVIAMAEATGLDTATLEVPVTIPDLVQITENLLLLEDKVDAIADRILRFAVVSEDQDETDTGEAWEIMSDIFHSFTDLELPEEVDKVLLAEGQGKEV